MYVTRMLTDVQKNQADKKKPDSEHKLQYQQHNVFLNFKINYVSSRNQIRNIPLT
jgi:hypothetical protein